MHSTFLCSTGTGKKQSPVFVILLTAFLVGCGGNQTPAPPAPQSHQQPALTTIGSGTTVSPDYFGMHLQCVVAPCENGVVDPYPSTLGFTTIRLWDTISWFSLEPSAEGFNWTRLDSIISQAASHGVTSFVFTLGSMPSWASSNPTGSCGSSPAGQCYPPSLPAMDRDRKSVV